MVAARFSLQLRTKSLGVIPVSALNLAYNELRLSPNSRGHHIHVEVDIIKILFNDRVDRIQELLVYRVACQRLRIEIFLLAEFLLQE